MKNLFISYAYEHEIHTTANDGTYGAASYAQTEIEKSFGNMIIPGDNKKLEDNHEIMALENYICHTKSYIKVTIINFRRVE